MFLVYSGNIWKQGILYCWGNASNKEEYRRASAIKQNIEGIPYRTIARNLDVNYRNVYNWIKDYKEHGLDGIRSKRNNAGKIPKISSDKDEERINRPAKVN